MNSKCLENMRWWQKGDTGISGELPRDESGLIPQILLWIKWQQAGSWVYSTRSQLTLMSYFWLTLGPTSNLLSLSLPAQINMNKSWKSFGYSGMWPHPWAAASCGNRGRNLGIDVSNTTCTLWNCPQEGQDVPKCWWHQMGAPGATPELPQVSWLADGDTGPAGKGKLEHESHLKWGKSSCWFGMLAKTGQEQLGK